MCYNSTVNSKLKNNKFKFKEEALSTTHDWHGKYIIPVTINIHLAIADGFHLSQFFIEVQELINSLN